MTVACACLGEGHADSMLRSQNDHGTRFDRLPGRQLEIVFSEQRAQDHKNLQHRVVAADAASRAGSEGQISKGSVLLLIGLAETLRIETLRVLPVPWRMMGAVNIDNHCRSPRNVEVACAVVRDSH